ncbi:MAG TPA: serine/threonine-protein kinase [Sandaracinaceae bacterium LLY-WYZ-13_1]|nr:serine/threonine-protein kinase [Sandaracinaceae bacterium LLY-WYZ-13_1]
MSGPPDVAPVGGGLPEDARALLQRRVALFAGFFASVNAVGLLSRSLLLATGGEELFFIPRSTLLFQAGATLALGAVWLTTRRGRRSARTIRLVEALGLLLTALCYEVLALVLTLDVIEDAALRSLAANPDTQMFAWFAVILPLVGVSFVLTYAMILRAAFVPTASRHTALLTALIGAPLAAVAWVAGLGTAPMGLTFFSPPTLALGGAFQWAFTVVVCAAVSRVIYGLREEVREARRLGQYTLEGLIGEGGMGMVYRASHAMLRRPTAIKLLPPDRAGRDALERFEREVQLTARLTHPHTVTIFDYGRTADGVFYYAMELLDGATLEEVVDVDGPQPPARVVRILEQVAGALGEAHAVGLIHRDVKPSNVVLCRQGGELDVAKVVDFGLVKDVSPGAGAAVSQEGTISGTPLYMAPEILTERDAASPRSDLYALGAVGYYLLTGQHVFGGDNVIEVLGHHLHSEPVPPAQRLGDAVPEDLSRVILDCLAKDPEARPTDAADLRRRLEACAVGRWTQRRAELWWEAHGPVLTASRSRPPPAPRRSATTVEVDLGRRSAETDAVADR